MQADNEFQKCATEAAAFAVQMGCRTIEGKAVMAIQSYLGTAHIKSRWSEDQRHALLGTAFDIFASAVRREGN